MQWAEFSLAEQQSFLGRFSLWRGIFCLVGSTGAWAFFLFSQVNNTHYWAGIASFAVGNYLFHRSDFHRRRGQLRLSRTLDYSVKNKLFKEGGIRTSKRSRHSNAEGAAFFIAAMIPYILGLTQLVEGLQPLWRAIWAGTGVLEHLPTALFGLLFGAIGMTIAWALVSFGFRKFELIVASTAELEGAPYVLYLRPFQFDSRLNRPERPIFSTLARGVFATQGTNTEEERLELALSWAGPIVTVGRPAEGSSHLGVPRIYVGEDWHSSVRQLMREARLVVLVLDSGESMRWELNEAVRGIAPERLIILVRFKRPQYERVRTTIEESLRDQSDRFNRVAERVDPVRLPDYKEGALPAGATIKGLIYFEDWWRPTYVPLEQVPLIEDKLAGSLDRAFWAPMLNLEIHERSAR